MSGIILPRGLAVQPQSRAALDASYIPFFVWNGCTPYVDLVSGLTGRVMSHASVDVARQKTTPLGRVISKQATNEYIDFVKTTGPGSSFTVVLQFVATGATNNTVLFANRTFWNIYNGVFIGYANGAANNIQLAGSSAFINVATPGIDAQKVNHTLVVRFRGNVADVALDGRFCGTATGLGVPNSTWNGLGIGNYATRVNSGGGLADFSLCAVLLSKNINIVGLSLNPWKIFQRQQTRLWFDAAGSSGASALAGNAQAIASATGALSVAVPVAGAAVGVVTATGSLSTAMNLSGAAAAVAVASGNLTLGLSLSGAAIANAVASGALGIGFPLAGAAQATATAAGNLGTGAALSGAAQIAASATGAMQIQVSLSGAAIATAAATGNLTAAGSSALAGSAQAQASASGILSTSLPLAGNAQVVAAASGNLTNGVPLSGAAVAVVTALGNIAVTVTLSGAAVAQAIATGELALSIPLAGAAIMNAIAAGYLSVSGGAGPVGSVARSFILEAEPRQIAATMY